MKSFSKAAARFAGWLLLSTRLKGDLTFFLLPTGVLPLHLLPDVIQGPQISMQTVFFNRAKQEQGTNAHSPVPR